MEPSEQTNSKIHLLPEHIIDQIKAGEVIERPSTLIKEILENSIDASSTKVDLHIVNNGIDLISLTDNGTGMNGDDLPLAFCRHATSKIDKFEDIYHLNSYGFRGEALASIASIAKITCETNNGSHTSIIKIEGGEEITHLSEPEKTSHSGTKLFIKDLFFNTPVRLKFIQSKTSEKNQLKKMINAFLLTQEKIEFSIKWDDAEKFFFQAQESKLARFKDVLYRKQTPNVFVCENVYDGTSAMIFLTEESNRGNAHKFHYIFVNGRYIQDIAIHKVILNTAKFLWPEGETGNYAAYINIPADEIDVNIHPNKTVVKFFKPSQVYAVLSASIKELTSKLQFNEVKKNRHLENTPQENFLSNSNYQYEKDIQYKSASFNEEQNLEEYLENLHNKEVVQENFNMEENIPIKIFKKISLYKIQNKIYLVKDFKILQKLFVMAIKRAMNSEDTIPLLISRPIKLNHDLAKKQINFLSQLGYEVDILDGNTLMIRSFPEELKNYPYIKLVEYIIKKNVNHTNEIQLKDLEPSDFKRSELKDYLRSSPLSILIQEKDIIPIDEDVLEKLYE